jgi:cytochrome c oxidase assembly protein subunit 15
MVLQILLGMQIIQTFRKADVTTSHVVVGALLLATTFWLTWVAHRNRIETSLGARRPNPELGSAGRVPVPRA